MTVAPDKRIADLLEVLELCLEYTSEQPPTADRAVVLYEIARVILRNTLTPE